MLSAIFLITKYNLKSSTVLGVCFVLGGGIGNVYDRLVHGSVTDFLFIDFGIFHTGIFNMADVSIMIGTFLIVVSMYSRAGFRVNR